MGLVASSPVRACGAGQCHGRVKAGVHGLQVRARPRLLPMLGALPLPSQPVPGQYMGPEALPPHPGCCAWPGPWSRLHKEAAKKCQSAVDRSGLTGVGGGEGRVRRGAERITKHVPNSATNLDHPAQ